MIINNTRKTSDPVSGYFAFRKGLNTPEMCYSKAYKALLFILSINPTLKVADVPYFFQDRKNGNSKIVKSCGFIKNFLIEILIAKKNQINWIMEKHWI